MGDDYNKILSLCKHQKISKDFLNEHIKKTIKEILDILVAYTEQVDDLRHFCGLLESGGQNDQNSPSIDDSPCPKDITTATDFYKNDKLWSKCFPSVLNGEWNLKDQPGTIDAYAFLLLGFYVRSLQYSEEEIDKVIPTMLIVEQKVRTLHGFHALYFALHEPVKTKHKQDTNRKIKNNEKKEIRNKAVEDTIRKVITEDVFDEEDKWSVDKLINKVYPFVEKYGRSAVRDTIKEIFSTKGVQQELKNFISSPNNT